MAAVKLDCTNKGGTHYAVHIAYSLNPSVYHYKKDGYRQQNVRQRQKLISIVDYDVCMTFY